MEYIAHRSSYSQLAAHDPPKLYRASIFHIFHLADVRGGEGRG